MEEKHSSVILLAALAAGIGLSLGEVDVFCLIIYMLLICYTSIRCRLLFSAEDKNILTCILILVFFIVGFSRGYIFNRKMESNLILSDRLKGRVEIIKQQGQNKYVARICKNKKIKLLLSTEERLLPGMVLSVKDSVKIPDEEMNRGGFSYSAYLMYQGISYVFRPKKIVVIEQRKNLSYYLALLQEKYIERIRLEIGDSCRYVESIFFGRDEALLEEEKDVWRKMGIMHLQAVSGSQVGVVVDIVLFIYVASPKRGTIKYILLMMPLFLYGMMTDSPSVWRAVLFISVMKIFQCLRIEKYEMAALMISALILLMLNPGVLFSVSFQLSYLIAGGIILYSSRIRNLGSPFLRISATGFLCLVVSWPIMATCFQEIPLMGIVFTPLFSPLIQLIIVLCAVLLILFPLSFFLQPLMMLLEFLILILEKSIWVFKDVKLPVIHGRPWSLLTTMIFYLMFLFLDDRECSKKIGRKLAVVLVILSIAPLMMERMDREKVVLTFLNVGQGDSILIECRNIEKNILIDGGPCNEYSDMGKYVVEPYLRRRGIARIDYVISTHSDNDHIGGLTGILDNFMVDTILIPAGKSADYKDWTYKYGTKIREASKGMILRAGEIVIEILNPPGGESKLDENGSSIVISFQYGNSSVLLTGDCDLELLEELVDDKRTFDIVKAPHHGSQSSFRKGIYEDLGAREVIFSVGPNLYGHPSKKILKDLTEEAINIYRTDLDKEIEVALRKNLIKINGMNHE